MNIIKTISSLQKAFSLFLGLSPRTLPPRILNPKIPIISLDKSRILSSVFIRTPKTYKSKVKPIKDQKSCSSFVQVLGFPIVGPEIKRFQNLDYHIIHRVAVRSVVQALHTTESRELSESEFELINTTHSSFVDSEDSRL